MNIFITGIAGFLGSHLADKMISLGHTVHGNDNLIGGYLDNVNPQAIFHNVDCRDLDAMVQITKNMDIVIHTAATAHEGLSVFSPSFITKNIFEASVSTISASVQNKVKRFVFCSSTSRADPAHVELDDAEGEGKNWYNFFVMMNVDGSRVEPKKIDTSSDEFLKMINIITMNY